MKKSKKASGIGSKTKAVITQSKTKTKAVGFKASVTTGGGGAVTVVGWQWVGDNNARQIKHEGVTTIREIDGRSTSLEKSGSQIVRTKDGTKKHTDRFGKITRSGPDGTVAVSEYWIRYDPAAENLIETFYQTCKNDLGRSRGIVLVSSKPFEDAFGLLPELDPSSGMFVDMEIDTAPQKRTGLFRSRKKISKKVWSQYWFVAPPGKESLQRFGGDHLTAFDHLTELPLRDCSFSKARSGLVFQIQKMKPLMPAWKLRASDQATFDAITSALSDSWHEYPDSTLDEPAQALVGRGAKVPANVRRFSVEVFRLLSKTPTNFIHLAKLSHFVQHSASAEAAADAKAFVAALIQRGIACNVDRFCTKIDVQLGYHSHTTSSYTVNLLAMTQCNTQTNFSRRMRRFVYDPAGKNERLYLAARQGNAQEVNLLLDQGAEVTTQTFGFVNEREYNWTPLIAGACYGHLKCVQLLLDACGRSPFPLMLRGSDVLIEDVKPASKNAGAGKPQRLLFKSKKVPENDLRGNGISALGIASWAGHEGIVGLLLEWGQTLGMGPDQMEQTLAANRWQPMPIMLAAFRGHTAVVETLLRAGASVQCSTGGKSKTAADFAKEAGFRDLEGLLRTHMVDAPMVVIDRVLTKPKVLSLMPAVGLVTHSKSEIANAVCASLECTMELVSSREKAMEALDESVAVFVCALGTNESDLLFDGGTSSKAGPSSSLLRKAQRLGVPAIVYSYTAVQDPAKGRLCTKAGAAAVVSTREELAKVLARVTYSTNRALVCAAAAGNEADAKEALAAIYSAESGGGISSSVDWVNPNDRREMTALLVAAISPVGAVVLRLLTKGGANIEARSARSAGGRTALIEAAFHGHTEHVAVLLEAGASVTSVDRDGKTAEQWARANDHKDVIAALSSATTRTSAGVPCKALMSRAYAHAIEAGGKELSRSKLGLCGQGRVGKTCLLRSLLHQPFEEQVSTVGAHAADWIETSIGADKCTLDRFNVRGWAKYDSRGREFDSAVAQAVVALLQRAMFLASAEGVDGSFGALSVEAQAALLVQAQVELQDARIGTGAEGTVGAGDMDALIQMLHDGEAKEVLLEMAAQTGGGAALAALADVANAGSDRFKENEGGEQQVVAALAVVEENIAVVDADDNIGSEDLGQRERGESALIDSDSSCTEESVNSGDIHGQRTGLKKYASAEVQPSLRLAEDLMLQLSKEAADGGLGGADGGRKVVFT
jgi:ankyrin repeat protein